MKKTKLTEQEKEQAYKFIFAQVQKKGWNEFKAKDLQELFQTNGISKSLRQCQRIIQNARDYEEQMKVNAYLLRYPRRGEATNEVILQELKWMNLKIETILAKLTGLNVIDTNGYFVPEEVINEATS
tara:strand:+ start:1511 stop:1891 length:381 start_codon:yes stop_codon:yes gene_type:complete